MWGVGIDNGTCTCRSVENIIKLVHSQNTGGEPELIILWHSYTASSASDVSTLLVCMALHPRVTHRHCSKLSVTPLLIIMNITKQQYSQPISCFQVTQVRWEVSGQLQLYCLSRLNPWFISCVCAITYLSLSIIFTADTSSSCSSSWVHAIVHQYTVIYKAFPGLHGSQEPGCNKCGENDTYIVDTDIDTFIPHMEGIVMINVGACSCRLAPIKSILWVWVLLGTHTVGE